jgi:putative CocE/NonD family hydrolase
VNAVAQEEHAVLMHDHVQIPMRDGVLLSARIWLPVGADDRHQVPALLEYLPYRKGDWTAPRDAQRHPWYAAHGYASVRVDLRGSGDSQGVMTDEYTPLELQDAMDVIEWLAAQPWCTGKVGMFGISWGGFNSLQVAALRPEPLKAIVTVCSTDDRYADDVHYFGGAVLGIDMVAWATTMLAFTARPPDPARVGPVWRDLWQKRLEALDPFLDTWISHQERDAYWQHGSVCEDYASIDAAVLAVGGWADPYRNTVFRLVENLSCPVKGIIGPWPHQYPDIDCPPGPAIGFLQETRRWWDHWLKGEDTGVTEDPALRLWMQDSVRPATHYPTRSGDWVTEPSWPSPNVDDLRLPLADLTCPGAVGTAWVRVASPQHTGIDAGRYFPFGNPSDLPPDQREEDGRSVCFDTPPLEEPVDVLGLPAAHLRVTARAAANVVVRLCDVAPDGSSTLVTRGCLNLLKRSGMARVEAVADGEVMDVEVPMVAIAWSFPVGHRIRLSVSDAYWPWVWPQPGHPELRVEPAASTLVVPSRRRAAGSQEVRFKPPEQAAPLPVEVHARRPRPEREVRYQPESGEWQLTVDPNYGGARTYPDGLVYDEAATEVYSIRAADPLTAAATSTWSVDLRRPGWEVGLRVHGRMTADANDFVTAHEVVASLDGERVFERRWERRVPRTSA